MLFDWAPDQGTDNIWLQRPNSFDEPPSVAQRYSELLEIGFRQVWKHVDIDRVIGERWLIACEAQVTQPIANFHANPRPIHSYHHFAWSACQRQSIAGAKFHWDGEQEDAGYRRFL